VISPRAFLVVALLASGCTYPEFAFESHDAAADDTAIETSIEDTSIVETSIEDTTPEETAMDDTRVEDSSAADTTVVDTGTDAKDAAVDAKDSAIADAADAKIDPCTGHTFCSTFDTSTVTGDGWTGNYTTGGGTTTLDTSTSVTAPKSLHASIPTGTVTAAANLSLTLTSPTPTTKFRVESDVRLESLTYPAVGTSAILLKVQRDSTGDGVSLVVQSTGLFVEANGVTYNAFPVMKTIATKTWFHVRLEGTLQKAGGSATLYIDDMTTPVVNVTGISTAVADDTNRQPLIGIFSYMTSSAFEARFDNYTFDFLP
jgi:hypothetical protein